MAFLVVNQENCQYTQRGPEMTHRGLVSTGVVAVAFASMASASTTYAATPKPVTTVGSVTVQGAWRTTWSKPTTLRYINEFGQTITRLGVETELVSIGPLGTCTLHVSDDPPSLAQSPTGTAHVDGYSEFYVSVGCTPTSWTHRLYEGTTLRKSVTATVNPGTTQPGLLNNGCTGSSSRTWKNNTTRTVGATANLACSNG